MRLLSRYIVFLIALFATITKVDAQRRPMLRQLQQGGALRRGAVARRVDNIKRDYISQRLRLTQDEGNRFWPVYERYQAEIEGIAQARRANNNDPDPNQFKRELDYQKQSTEVQNRYYDEFSRVLSPEKANQVMKSERDFKVELLRRLKEGGEPANQPNQPPE